VQSPACRRTANAFDAPLVVSNAAALTTLDLVGENNLPAKFVRRQRRMTPAPSAVVVFVGTDLDLAAMGATHETFRPLHYDHDRTWLEVEAGRPAAMWGSVSTVCDPGLAPPGHHTLTITCLARDDIGRPSAEERERYVEGVLDAWEPVFPGLRNSLTLLETSTPDTLKRRIGNTGGAIYGWDNTRRTR
jgi:phytoene dehydrogenase-like protein